MILHELLLDLDSSCSGFLAEEAIASVSRDSDMLDEPKSHLKPVWLEAKKTLRDMDERLRTNRVLRAWLALPSQE